MVVTDKDLSFTKIGQHGPGWYLQYALSPVDQVPLLDQGLLLLLLVWELEDGEACYVVPAPFHLEDEQSGD